MKSKANANNTILFFYLQHLKMISVVEAKNSSSKTYQLFFLYILWDKLRAAIAKGNFVEFSKSKCWIWNPNGNLCGTGLLVGKLYQLDCEPVSAEHASVAHKQHSDLDLWSLNWQQQPEENTNWQVNSSINDTFLSKNAAL